MSIFLFLMELFPQQGTLSMKGKLNCPHFFLLRGHDYPCDFQFLPKRFSSLPLLVVSGSLATFFYTAYCAWSAA